MPYIARNPEAFLKLSVGTGQCVALAERAAMAPRTQFWRGQESPRRLRYSAWNDHRHLRSERVLRKSYGRPISRCYLFESDRRRPEGH